MVMMTMVMVITVMVMVIMIAHRAHQLRCLWVVVSWAGLTSVGDAGGEWVVELGAEAEVGVEEVEEEVEGAVVDQVRDEPEIKNIRLDGDHDDGDDDGGDDDEDDREDGKELFTTFLVLWALKNLKYQ